MPVAEREWLARSAFLATLLLFTLVVAVAWTPSDKPTPATFSDLPQESVDAP